MERIGPDKGQAIDRLYISANDVYIPATGVAIQMPTENIHEYTEQ
jgi:hypothetical protein